jgi:hypothetical protein
MMSAHRRDSDQPEGFDESSGAARMYWITPEISLGCARRMPGERFEAFARLTGPSRLDRRVERRSVWLAISYQRNDAPDLLGSDRQFAARKRAFASRTSRAARKLPTECASNRRKRARVGVFTN